MTQKKISVIMSYLNSEKFIKDSIDSILNQTYTNIELILLNDGSSDKSQEIVDNYKDKRIIKLNNKSNLGVANSFNTMINYASGDYIAFMDSDDISKINRLEEQYNFIKENNLDMCGSNARQFGKGKEKNINIYEKLNDIKTLMIIGNPIINSTVMIKSKILKKFKCNPNFISWDFELHSRIILSGYKFKNLNKILLFSRSHDNQDSILNFKKGIQDSYEISKKYFYEQKDIMFFEKHLLKVNFGYKEKVNLDEYKKSIIAFRKILQLRNNNLTILNLFNKNLVFKIFPINLFIFIKVIKIIKKYEISLEYKHKFLLLFRALLKFDSKNFLINFFIKIFYVKNYFFKK